MPIYEYQCSACGHRLEKLQKISDPPLTDCPACGQAELVKLISPAAFRLKGSGWYETDFKTGHKRNLIGDPSGPPPSSDGGSGSSDASAPAASGSESGSGNKNGTGDTKPAAATSKSADS